VAQPYFTRTKKQALEQYEQLLGTGKASNDLKAVVAAAYGGRIEVLFTNLDEQRWGKFDPASEEVIIHEQEKPGDDDLLNFAAIHTYLHDGTIYTLTAGEMPDGALTAALLRY